MVYLTLSEVVKLHCFTMEECVTHAHIQRGGGGGRAGGPDLPKINHKNIEFISNTGPDPLKNHKLPSQIANVGLRFAGGPMMARL